MSLLVDIKTLLTSINSNIFLGDRPDTPDNCLAIYPTGGQESLHTMGVKNPTLEKPSFQVVIRNASFATATTQAESIKDVLNGLTKQTINSNLYEVIFMQGDILNLGKDDRERVLLSLNFIAWVNRI